jgi:pimeloyl-ACP methyl ester carboxylesterase
MTKENLIIVPGFGTNSRLFEELRSYLSDFFSVCFIDLPGFNQEIPALPKITMDNYAQFVVDRIKELKLKHYLIAGMSLGFGIISRIEFDNKCKGVLGIGPYLGSESINPRMKAEMGFKILLLDLICFFRLYRLAWQTVLFRRFLKRICLNRQLPDFTLKEMDPRTYFETARLLLRFHLKKPSFDHLPYVLIMNKKDDLVSYDYLAQQMKDNIEKLLVVNTKMAHNPPVLTEKYFAANLPKSKILRLLKFIEESQPPSPWSRLINWFKGQFWPQKAVKS